MLAPQRFAAWLDGLRTCYWNIHTERVDEGHTHQLTPEEAAERTVKYLAAYACGVALHNDRLLAIEEDQVVFNYKDYRDHGRVKIARVDALEFIDRFLLHVVPRHVRHIRNYGFLSPNQRGKKLALIRKLLGLPEVGSAPQDAESLQEESAGEAGEASAGQRHCGVCHVGVLLVIHWPRPTIAQIMQLPLEALRQYRLPFQ